MGTHSSIIAWRIPMDRGAWWATVHGIAKLDLIEPPKDHIKYCCTMWLLGKHNKQCFKIIVNVTLISMSNFIVILCLLAAINYLGILYELFYCIICSRRGWKALSLRSFKGPYPRLYDCMITVWTDKS